MPIGYKMVRQDGTSFYDKQTQYAVGAVIECDGPVGGSCGQGLHLGREKHSPLSYNAQWPCRLLECSYEESDVLGQDDGKVRVRKLKVLRELDPWDVDLPNAKRVYDMASRISSLKPGEARINRRKIHQLVKEHAKRLSAHDARHQAIEIKAVKFYTPAEWASVQAGVRDSVRAGVWDSVWASVRASVWASVRDSVWASVWASVLVEDQANYGLPLVEILENGAVLYSVDKDGTAHVILLGKGDDQ